MEDGEACSPVPDRGPRAAPLEGRLRDGLIAWHKAQTARSSKPKLRSSFSDRLSIGATTSLLFRSEADSLTASRLCVPRVARTKLVCSQDNIKMAIFQAPKVMCISPANDWRWIENTPGPARDKPRHASVRPRRLFAWKKAQS